MPEIPSWLNASPQRYGELWAEGQRIRDAANVANQQIGLRKQALDQSAEMADMQIAAKEKQLEQQGALAQTKLAIGKAYQDQMLEGTSPRGKPYQPRPTSKSSLR